MSDIPGGHQLGEFLDPVILAFEDAINEGRLNRAVELLPLHVSGLPAGSAKNVKQAYTGTGSTPDVSLVLSTGVADRQFIGSLAISSTESEGSVHHDGRHHAIRWSVLFLAAQWWPWRGDLR